MTDGRRLLVRCEASVAIGTGHVMRCLALAQAWQDAGGRAAFAMAMATPAVEERLRRESIEVVRLNAEPGSADDAKETIALAREKQASWVVVDGYGFGADYQAALKGAGMKVLFIDDNGHAEHYPADLVLNQNAHANEALYRNRESSTRMLLGPRYALLRREFAARRGWKREIPAIARNVLVTMGGSDPDNFTREAVGGVRAVKDESLRIRVLAGGSNPHFASLEELSMEKGKLDRTGSRRNRYARSDEVGGRCRCRCGLDLFGNVFYGTACVADRSGRESNSDCERICAAWNCASPGEFKNRDGGSDRSRDAAVTRLTGREKHYVPTRPGTRGRQRR